MMSRFRASLSNVAYNFNLCPYTKAALDAVAAALSASKLALEAEQHDKTQLAETLGRERKVSNWEDQQRLRKASNKAETDKSSASHFVEGAAAAVETEKAAKHALDGRVAAAMRSLSECGAAIPQVAAEALQEEHARRLQLEASLEAALAAASGGAAGLLASSSGGNSNNPDPADAADNAATNAALANTKDGTALAQCLERERARRLAAESQSFSLLLSFSRAAGERERMTERIAEERLKHRLETERVRAEAAVAATAAAAAEARLRTISTKLLMSQAQHSDAAAAAADSSSSSSSSSAAATAFSNNSHSHARLPQLVEEALLAVTTALPVGLRGRNPFLPRHPTRLRPSSPTRRSYHLTWRHT